MNALSSLLLKVQCIRLLTKECLQSSAEADSIINDTHVVPTDKSGIIYLIHSRTSCGAAPRAKPKARLCEGIHIDDSPAREAGGQHKAWGVSLKCHDMGYTEKCHDIEYR